MGHSEAIGKHGRESFNWRCNESPNCFKKARHASAVDYLFPFGGKIWPPNRSSSKAHSPWRRCQDRGASSQILPCSSIIINASSPPPPPSPAQCSGWPGGAEDSSNAKGFGLLWCWTCQANGHGEGLNLDEALALHYAVENCTREVVKALLELGAANVNYPAGPAGKHPCTSHLRWSQQTW